MKIKTMGATKVIKEACVWCGVETEKQDGPVHRYLESSSGCWALYGELLSKEYTDREFMVVHGLTVDAYALQHPGRPNNQTINSVNVHLASLYAHFCLNIPVTGLAKFKQKIVISKDKFEWLEPPHDLTGYTVENVLKAKNPMEHALLVEEWAQFVFHGWQNYHLKIAGLIKDII